jgi:hypothetical protein
MDYLIIPNPKKELTPIRYDMRVINYAEGRVSEIAIVTATKAPELMATFSKACFELGRHFSDLHLQHRLAKKRLNDRKAVLILDSIPDKIQEKKAAKKDVSNNEDTRQAIMDLDPEYSEAWVAEAQTEAALLLIERKVKDMEGALNAVKKILGETYGIFHRPNPNMNNVVEERQSSPQETSEVRGVKFGKVNY